MFAAMKSCENDGIGRITLNLEFPIFMCARCIEILMQKDSLTNETRLCTNSTQNSYVDGTNFSDYLDGIGVRENMSFDPKTGTQGQGQDISRTCPGQVQLRISTPPFFVQIIFSGNFESEMYKRYSWIADQRDAHTRLICQQTRRATTISRPLLESSDKENLDLPGLFFCDHFLTYF